MTAAVTSQSTLVYGSLTLGGASNYEPHGQFTLTVSYDLLTISYPFVVTGSLTTAAAALETALRVVGADLTLTWNGSSQSWKSSTGTGFNHRGRLEKPGNERDTRLTRYYLAVIEVELPADTGSQGGRKNARETIAYNRDRRRTLTLTGQYTGIAGTVSAAANYAASIATYHAAVRSALGGEWDLVSERRAPNDEDSLLDYELVFEEVLFLQAAVTTNHATLVDPRLVITHSKSGSSAQSPSSDYATLTEPVRVTANYSTGVDQSVVTSTRAGLESVWSSVGRPFVVGQIKAYLPGLELALVADAPVYDLRDGEISGSMELWGYAAAGPYKILSRRFTVARGGRPSQVIIPVASGSPYAAHVAYGPAISTLTISDVYTVIGDKGSEAWKALVVDGDDIIATPADVAASAGGGIWVPTSVPQPRVVLLRVGIEPDVVPMLDITYEQTWRRVDTPVEIAG